MQHAIALLRIAMMLHNAEPRRRQASFKSDIAPPGGRRASAGDGTALSIQMRVQRTASRLNVTDPLMVFARCENSEAILVLNFRRDAAALSTQHRQRIASRAEPDNPLIVKILVLFTG